MKKELNQEELFKEEYNKFIQWAFNTGWTYYIDLNQWRKSVQYKTTNELHDIYKTVLKQLPFAYNGLQLMAGVNQPNTFERLCSLDIR